MTARPWAYPPALMSTPEAATYVGLSVTTFRELGLPRKKLGARVLYDKRDLDDFIANLPYDGQEAHNSCDDVFSR